ncbi:hypothetical protein A8V01_08990 [Novosphingobium guangzhouense]|uniref:GapR-like DNA-binding domain-containing protein n=1 Tax=Novosphingobium guangzhouense TaxID=1850347 RepID=A0A2K2FUP4_9SPHN|nr:hypothetical protein A8V01_08990 [Novosphingobium guangzhouense]
MSDDRLRLYVERIERLLEERKGITQDITDVYNEAKAVGYDAATIRKLIARRGMKAEDRAEGDMLLETYEAALGGLIEPEVRTVDERAQALAIAMLADQIAGIEDPDQAKILIGHVMWLLDLREEIRAMRTEESARKKEASSQGFDAKQLGLTVRWYEKVAKHGEDAMRAGEATFHLYRSTVDGRPEQVEPTQDETLARLFAPKPTKAPPKRVKTLTAHRAAAEAARRALRGEL